MKNHVLLYTFVYNPILEDHDIVPCCWITNGTGSLLVDVETGEIITENYPLFEFNSNNYYNM